MRFFIKYRFIIFGVIAALCVVGWNPLIEAVSPDALPFVAVVLAAATFASFYNCITCCLDAFLIDTKFYSRFFPLIKIVLATTIAVIVFVVLKSTLIEHSVLPA